MSATKNDFLGRHLFSQHRNFKYWIKNIQMKKMKNCPKLSQSRHRIFPVPLPKHFVKVPSLLHYVLKLLRTIALQSQLTKNN